MERRHLIRAVLSAGLLRSGLSTGLVRVALPALPTALLAGCFGGRSDSPHTWWELVAPESSDRAEPNPIRARQSLVVEGIAAGVLYDGTTLLYSRAPGERSSYQFASWTERPAARLARLAKSRLQARGGFRDVSTAEAGVAPDLLLTLTLEGLFHDLSVEPGLLRLRLGATLTDWHRRRPIATRRFEVNEPVPTEDAAGAAQAAGRAAGRLLDDMAPWVEASAVDEGSIRRTPGSRRAAEARPLDDGFGREGSVSSDSAAQDGVSSESPLPGSDGAGASGPVGAPRSRGQPAAPGVANDSARESTGAGAAGPRRRAAGKTRPPGYGLNRDGRTTSR